ncbi:MAG: hypothetical protein HOH43_13210, partial [Candidatus Latescibacteria bacterium]|nr:hypothetical protein [Candidatus Latescibacterota bacterium]
MQMICFYNRVLRTIILVTMVSVPTFAKPDAGTGHWQRFGLPDQLASIRVLSMVQDSQGYLWFGSDGWGVFRFDGVNL